MTSFLKCWFPGEIYLSLIEFIEKLNWEYWEVKPDLVAAENNSIFNLLK